jgi:phytoene dehydrogenase-like protein
VVSVLVHFVPFRLRDGWTPALREELGDRVVLQLGRHARGLPGRIVGREVLTPADLAERYGLVEGHLHHGDHALDQILLRPTPECARYRTPVEGLFLCGSGSHPGGGVTGGPGALAAQAILRL